jgi:general secretion pathway protein G
MASYKRSRRGFTLVEVLLVLAIVGFLALIGIMATGNILEKAKVDTTKAVIAEVESALDVYNAHVGHYPTEEEGGLTALLTKPNFETEAMGDNWHGPYVKKAPTDAWSRPLHYELVQATASGTSGGSTTTQTVHISSDGADGQTGTQDDIKNWSDDTTGK